MKEEVDKLLTEIREFRADTEEALEQFRIRFLGRKGVVKDLSAKMKDVAPEDRKEFGQQLNAVKTAAKQKFDELSKSLKQSDSGKGSQEDLTRPVPGYLGSRHPISLVRERITNIFAQIGFSVAEGPEIEDDWHNFTALNFPEDHPARDMQDTFFIADAPGMALRTHTSSVQIRVMENRKPPMRILAPGRVYRNEAISARAHCFFHQVEGFYVDRDVSFADLKQTIRFFARELFGEETEIRLRPSYFPFTEPSAEVDVSCTICEGKGCNVCKYTGWLEIMGCGMIDPNVLENCGIDSEEYSGYAFGMGIERIAQLKYRVNDLRLYSENDIRFLKQFTSEI